MSKWLLKSFSKEIFSILACLQLYCDCKTLLTDTVTLAKMLDVLNSSGKSF